MSKLLIIDDDERLRELLKKFLTENNFSVETAENAFKAGQKIHEGHFDMIICDIMMPGKSGLEFLAELRLKNNTPVLLLTAMGEPHDRVKGHKTGADDYLTKPFEPEELLLRINRILERSGKKTETISFGDFVFNLTSGKLFFKKEEISLSSSEEKVLKILTSYINTPVSRYMIADIMNGISERSVDVLITRLRSKIEPNPKKPKYILSERGVGYILKQ